MIKIPARGEALCVPPFASWKEAMEENVQDAEIFTLKSLKKRLRTRAAAIAHEYTVSLGEGVPMPDPSCPFIFSGHQPLFFHAGIIYKYRLLAETSPTDAGRIFMTVDTDMSEGFPVRIPTFYETHSTTIHRVLPSATNTIFAFAKTEEAELEMFRESILHDLEKLPEKIFPYGAAFIEKELRPPFMEFMRDTVNMIRRRYANPWGGGVLELPLSLLCESGEYFEFAYGMLLKAGELREFFNRTLAEYRKEHKIRSRANPFPDLGEKEGTVETLFWKVENGLRSPLYVRNENGKLRLATENGMEADGAESLFAACRRANIAIWPRAVSLSILNRLFLSDLFIHGVGGTKYDLVTDKLIPELYGIAPPIIATATCTLKTPDMNDPTEKLNQLRHKLREMDFHPERFAGITSSTNDLIRRKDALIGQIKLPGADKKSIGREIEEINASLQKDIAPVKKKLAGEVAAVEIELARFETLADRELPYFLFPPEAIPRPA